MLPPAAAALAPDAVLLRELLAVSLTGVIFYTPILAPGGAGEIVDFAFEYLNPAAQRMMSMPEVPTLTHMQQWPHSKEHGTFAFHVDAFVSGEPREYNINYQADGYDNYYRLAARRAGTGLLVSFTDTADQPRSPVEVALREVQAAEQAARADAETQRQRLYQLLMQLPAQVAAHHGPEHVYTLVNQRYQDYFPAHTLLGRSVREAVPEITGQGFVESLDHVFASGEPAAGLETPIYFDLTGTGRPELMYINAFYLPLRDAQGQVDGVLDFSYNVTEQVLARQQLQQLNEELEARVLERTQEVEAARAEAEEQRSRFERLFQQAPALINIFSGPEHVLTLVHPTTARLLGHRPLQGLPRRQALPELPEEQHAPLDHVYRTGEAVQQLERLTRLDLHNDGQLHDVYLDVLYQPLFEASGRIEGVMGFAIDVTERVQVRQRAEALQAEVLAAAQCQVREREAFHAVFEQTPALIALLRDPEHYFEYANPAYQQLLPGRTLVGRHFAEAVPEAVSQGFMALLDGVYRTGVTYYGAEVLLAVAPPNGEEARAHYFNFTYQAYREDGRIAGVSIFAFDVTDQVQARRVVEEGGQQARALAEELSAANQQLVRTNVDLDNFIYTASHDLKAPISNIEGLLALLQEELPSAVIEEAHVGPTLARMLDSVDRFKRTIDHLTEVSKLQKEYAPASALVSLAAVVEDVRYDLLPLLQETGAQLVIDVTDLPPIHFSEKNLRSIVYNLLSNAVKYHSPARPPRVEVRADVRAGHTVLEVHDNGLGLAEHQLPKLFGMFQRFHDHVEGSGIDLYMVKRMIENGGGRIEVRSQLDVGTTFFVHLPHTAAAVA